MTRTGRKGDEVPNKGKGSGRARSAITGRYVSKSYAARNPGKTVVEHDKKRKRK